MPDGQNNRVARRAFLLDLLHRGVVLTVDSAWTQGHAEGLYEGGEWRLVKDDLNAVGRRHDGFWRARSDEERRKAKRWADYWTAR